MDRVEEIRARVSQLAGSWPDESREEVMPYLGELQGYVEEVAASSHPDADELSGQLYQLIDNITKINGSPDA